MAFCPNVVASGRCDEGDCRYQHDIRKCSCDVFVLDSQYQQHLAGKRHKQLIARQQQQQAQAAEAAQEPATSIRCDACFLEFVSQAEHTQHQRSQAHRDAVAHASNVPPSEPIRPTGRPAEPGYLICNICEKSVHVDVWISHTTRHTSYQRKKEVSEALAESERDRNGVIVSYKGGIDFGILDPSEALHPELKRSAHVYLNVAPGSAIGLYSIKMASSTRGDHYGVKFSANILGQTKKIKPGTAKIVAVVFHPSYEGRYEDTLELTFHDITRKEQFVITRRVLAIVGSPEDYERLKPKSAYVRPKISPHERVREVVRVSRPPTWSRTNWRVPLPEFKIPEDLVNAAFGPKPSAAVRPFVPRFDIDNYGQFWQVLLWIEEEKMRRDLDMYAKSDVKLEPERDGYRLKIDGLDEGRPSIVVGDIILVRHNGDTSGKWYEGCVHEITGISIFVRFPKWFRAYRGSKVDVRFTLNRLPDRRMHQAVTHDFKRAEVLFPTPDMLRGIRRPTDHETDALRLVDRTLQQNREQLETIAAIVKRPPGSVPFVVFGPPGTGKTVTIVEAIRQLILSDPEAKILACAPSNSAADLIASRLTKNLNQNELFRLNAYARPFKALMPSLRDFSLYNDNGVFAIPPLEKLSTYKVIVSTCISAGIPYAIGFETGHFTHVFIDEAGQATEPMSMIAIKTLANEKTNMILAGDSKQLNPITHSALARGLGLGRSFLERLMSLSMYDEHQGKGVTIMKLVKHFRSHPDILHFPNAQFYRGELLPCADPLITHSLLNYEGLVKKNFPVIFHGIVGKDQREASSPSFFNIDEVTTALKYAKELVGDRKLRVDPERDIGIITPYHAQCQKILSVLPRELKGAKVGSVEEFQGQERRIIIISTVRSSTDLVAYDMQRTLGFVANPRRFNVAVTRAQSLLIVIGNPQTLSLDPMWRAWLNYVHQKGGWRGKEINWNPEEPVASGGYDEKTRAEAEAEAEEMIQRIRAQIMSNDSWAVWENETSDDEDNTGVEYAGRETY